MQTNKRINITYLIGQLRLGGAEQQLYYLLSGLDRTRFSPQVINLAPDQSLAWAEPIAALGVPVYSVPRSANRLKRVLQIQSMLGRIAVHIVHSWVFHTNIYAATSGILRHVPIRIGSMRTNPERLEKQYLLRWLGQLGLDSLLINSTTGARSLKNNQKSSVRCIPNGVPIPMPLSKAQIVELKGMLGFSSVDRLIGCVGRLDPNKNQAMLVRSFATLAERWTNIFLVLIGDGESNSELKQLVQLKGIVDRVRFVGELPQAARFLPAFEVNCLTSFYEGMPNAIMEASAAGLPVIATNTGGASEVVEHGKTGFLVQPDDDVALTTYLEQLLASPIQAASFGVAGAEKMAKEFSVARMVEKIVQMYEELLMVKCAS
jgi:glycosyltransferase involved in cell wall biosynthesis